MPFSLRGSTFSRHQPHEADRAGNAHTQNYGGHQLVQQLGREDAPHEKVVALHGHQDSVDGQKQGLADDAHVAQLIQGESQSAGTKQARTTST